MINNRQSSRRRGRGGSSQRSSGGSPGQRDSGNRIDSRSRGNAAQLLEKYKNMARDAQMSGDRVQVEYYLQFADHYFRVLADSRARSDDHRPIRPVDDFDGSDEEYGDEGEPIRAGEQDARPSPYQPPQGAPQPRRDDYRREDGRRDEGRRDDARRDDGRRYEPRRDDGRRDEAQGGESHREEPRREDRSRRDYTPRGDARANEDGLVEPPIAQANGQPYRERVANDLDESAAAGAEPRPSRRPSRGRTRPDIDADAAGVDADRLPPALGLTTDVATDDAPDVETKPKRRRRPSAPPEAQAG